VFKLYKVSACSMLMWQTTQWQKEKRTNNDLQNTTQKTKDRATPIPLKPGVTSGVPEGLNVSAPLVGPVDFDIYYSGYIQTHCQKNKNIKRADQILPEVYGTTLKTPWSFI
jgi:hypothetical protein